MIKLRYIDKQRRLRKNSEFVKLLKEGRIVDGRVLRLYYLDGVSKFGVCVGGEVKSAPQRNRIKRLIKEAYRVNRYKIKDAQILFFAKNSTLAVYKSYHVAAQMLHLLAKANLLKKNFYDKENID